jgi:hypothetical protein
MISDSSSTSCVGCGGLPCIHPPRRGCAVGGQDLVELIAQRFEDGPIPPGDVAWWLRSAAWITLIRRYFMATEPFAVVT